MSPENLSSRKPFRWPRKADLPFRRPESPDVTGLLAHDRLLRTVSIMDGFMLAGASLAEKAMNDESQRRDLVFPVLFSYRHATEIGLKWIITQYGAPVKIVPSRIDDTHDLWKLWADCRRLFREYGANHDDQTLTTLGTIIKQFHDWDKSGAKFRYADGTNGAMVIFQYSDIDIEHLNDVMSGVANFFFWL